MNIREISWEEAFTKAGAFWQHDGDPRRAYALLTSGEISDGFFDGDRVTRLPSLLSRAVGQLMHKEVLLQALNHPAYRDARPETVPPTTLSQPEALLTHELSRTIGRVVGAAYGAITFAAMAAHHAGCEFAFATKEPVLWPGGGGFDQKLSLDRYAQDFKDGECVLLAEETITTGKTLRELRDEVLRVSPRARILPCVIALCNRSGKTEIDGMKIASLISPAIKRWKEGSNPFTGGPELVPALRPKGRNWEKLKKVYSEPLPKD